MTTNLSQKSCGVAMDRKKEAPEGHAEAAHGLPPDLSLLLKEIENEPVPERLLALAQKLQQALVEKRRRDAAKASHAKEPSQDWVKQP